MIWRLVFEKVATYEEMQRSWTFDDIMKANAILDMQAALIENRPKEE